MVDATMSVAPLLSSALLLAACSAWLCVRLKPETRLAVSGAVFIAAILPGSAGHYLAALLGSLSITTTLLLIYYLFSIWRPLSSPHKIKHDLKLLKYVIAFVALGFYPASLGATMFDPYALGYSPVVLSTWLMMATVFAIIFKRDFIAGVIIIVFITYAANILESNNLWDYLMDPLLAVYCLPAFAGFLKSLIQSRLPAR